MDLFNVDDASAPEFPLALDLYGSSSQVSQPTASLETRLENLSLTAPDCTPEVSSLRASLPPNPVLHVYRSIQNKLHARESRRRIESKPFYLNLRRERLAQAKREVCARMSQYDMDSTKCISSSTGSDHEMNEGKYILKYLLI
ncbi:hypothetical protein TNCT_406611 [Trichonephila clavata]|uniref:Uncharacterized protein n=1 Tax=Trichonephila clavata TaxID=2740835 RepID=A0A8X6GMF4_TRICU|nr:hypothetical protein TNCT_406611 [Trichonephila clavata]